MHSESIGDAYLKYYARQQRGGSVDENVYRGARRWAQKGDGIGDVLRSAARFLMPVFFRSAKAFANNALDAGDRGASFQDAVTSSIKPALSAAAEGVVSSFGGGGKRRDNESSKLAEKRASDSSKTEFEKFVKRSKKAKRSKKTKRSKPTQSQNGKGTKGVAKSKKANKRKSQTGGKSQAGGKPGKRKVTKNSKRSHKSNDTRWNF